MCGIAYVKNLKDSGRVNDLMRVIYEGQRGRGNTAFGAVAFSEREYDVKHWISEGSFLDDLDSMTGYSEMMLHSRLPTSAGNRLNACHPFVIKRGGKIYNFIHNGIIGNAETIKAGHKALGVGVVYNSYDKKLDDFNDSEALAWDFVLYMEAIERGEVGEISCTGSVAFMCLVQDSVSLRVIGLYFYRNKANPITMLRTSGAFMLASEGLPDSVEAGKLFMFDYSSLEIVEVGALDIKTWSSSFGTGAGYKWEKNGSNVWEKKALGYDTDFDSDSDTEDNYGGYNYSRFDSDKYGFDSDPDSDDMGVSVVDSVTTYEQAIGALEWLAEDYSNYCYDVDDVDSMAEAGAILGEVHEICDMYQITDKQLGDMGLAFPVFEMTDNDIVDSVDEVVAGMGSKAMAGVQRGLFAGA